MKFFFHQIIFYIIVFPKYRVAVVKVSSFLTFELHEEWMNSFFHVPFDIIILSKRPTSYVGLSASVHLIGPALISIWRAFVTLLKFSLTVITIIIIIIFIALITVFDDVIFIIIIIIMQRGLFKNVSVNQSSSNSYHTLLKMFPNDSQSFKLLATISTETLCWPVKSRQPCRNFKSKPDAWPLLVNECSEFRAVVQE